MMNSKDIRTIEDADWYVQGIINDFEAGITTKEETLGLLGDYTARIMDIFWENAKTKIKANPELLNQ